MEIQNQTCRQRFLESLLDREKDKESHFNVITRDTYDKLVEEVEEAKSATRKTPLHYRRLKRFDVLETDGTKRLVSKGNSAKLYLAAEEVFDVIEGAHIAAKHGGRDRLKTITSKDYANITVEMINMFLSMCEVCRQKKSKSKGLDSDTKSADVIQEINNHVQVSNIKQ